MTFDLIIPTYKPGDNLLSILDIMSNQSIPLGKIIIINTEQKYFDRIVYEKSFLSRHSNIEVRHVSKKEFDCGRTRNMGVKISDSEYFLMLAQDAKPVGRDFVKNLLDPMVKDSTVAVSYARQLPRENADLIEKCEKNFYFPESAHVYSEKDLNTFGTDIYFLSNSAALYKRSIFDKLGGFINHSIMNEDVLYGASVINADYKIAYVPSAQVIYSKNLSVEDYGKISFDLGVCHAKHPEIYAAEKYRESGKLLYKTTIDTLTREKEKKLVKKYKKIDKLKKKSYRKGRKYRQLPMNIILKSTYNREYWRMDGILRDRSSLDSHAGYGRSDAELAMIKDTPVKDKK